MFLVLLGSCASSRINGLQKETKQYGRKCADSINVMRTIYDSPDFLNNTCLDYQKYFWKNMHSPLSLRRMIVDRVRSKEAITLILSSKNVNLNGTCDKLRKDTIGLTYYSIPFIEKSFKELLENRLSQLN